MVKRVVAMGLVLVLLASAAVAYAFLRPTEEASGPIEAIPLQLDPSPTSATAGETVAEATEVSASPTTEEAATEEPTAEPTSEEVAMEAPAEESTATVEATEAPTEEAAATETAVPAASEPTIFEIQQDSSEARFVIDEVLRGSPFTVVGTTNQVAGQIAIDPANPSSTQVGVIQVNARTFATDTSNRDRAIQNQVLQTNSYEFITFTPSSLVGLPETATVGQAITFQIVGDLTIKDQTRETTWDVTVTPISETEVQGTATTTINYADWGVSIPSVPFVASVAEQVRLEIDFVATAP